MNHIETLTAKALHTLVSIDTHSLADAVSVFRLSGTQVDEAASLLSPAPTGVPPQTARSVAASLKALVAAIDTEGRCYSTGSSCTATVKATTAVSVEAGRAMAKLIPYGTLTSDQILALIGAK